MKADFTGLWAESPSTLRREPTPAEIAGGFPCGPFDLSLFNELMFRLSEAQREIVYAIIQSGQTPNGNNTTQLWNAILSVAPATALVHSGADTSTNANALTIPAVAPAVSALADFQIYEFAPRLDITGAATVKFGAFDPVPFTRGDGTPLKAGDGPAGVPLLSAMLNGSLRRLGLSRSEVAVSVVTVINGLKIPGGTPFQYAAPGTYTLAVASGVTFGVRECRGAGGGGGGATGLNAAGSGGGGGGNTQGVYTATADSVLLITVGAGGTSGAGGSSPANGTAGGTTSIVLQSGAVVGTNGTAYTSGQTLCAATGGGFGYAGNGSPQSTSFGFGGVGAGAGLNDSGDAGGFPVGPIGGGNLGGSGGGSPGSGGSPGPNLGASGNSSSAPGVGGNGSSNNAPGGNGAPGRVTITK